jgi:hypothetical protein
MRAREWQHGEAWATWERMKAGDVREVSKQAIDRDFEEALAEAVRICEDEGYALELPARADRPSPLLPEAESAAPAATAASAEDPGPSPDRGR